MKKFTLVTVLVLALVISSFSVFADSEQSILSKVTGISDAKIAELREQRVGYGQLFPAAVLSKALKMDIEDVIALRLAGKTYYQIAEEKGLKAEEYKNDLLDMKNAYVDEQVKAGNLTSEQGKLVKDRYSSNIAACDGQTLGFGKQNGGCGMGNGFGMGNGNGGGRGFGRMSNGNGFGVNR